MTDDHNETLGVQPACGQPTGAVEEGAPDFHCQRGDGHPGVHEVMLSGGSRMTWGSTEAMDADRRAQGDPFVDLGDDEPEDYL